MSRKKFSNDFSVEKIFNTRNHLNKVDERTQSIVEENTVKKENAVKEKNTVKKESIIQEQRFRTTLDFDLQLHTKLKIVSAQLKKPIREIISESLEEYLKKYETL